MDEDYNGYATRFDTAADLFGGEWTQVTDDHEATAAVQPSKEARTANPGPLFGIIPRSNDRE